MQRCPSAAQLAATCRCVEDDKTEDPARELLAADAFPPFPIGLAGSETKEYKIDTASLSSMFTAENLDKPDAAFSLFGAAEDLAAVVAAAPSVRGPTLCLSTRS